MYEFILLGIAVNAGDLKSTDVTDFFSQRITTVSKRQKTNCRGNDDACTVAEQSSSRWEVHFELLFPCTRGYTISYSPVRTPPQRDTGLVHFCFTGYAALHVLAGERLPPGFWKAA